MIRSGKEEDIPRITEMLEDMKNASDYKDNEFCIDTVADVCRRCLGDGLLSVMEVDGVVQGFVGGVEGLLLFNRNIKTGHELAWWVDPDHRQGGAGYNLLSHIEGLARLKGIKHWNMGLHMASMPEVLEKLYEKMGYTKNEVIYSRVL